MKTINTYIDIMKYSKNMNESEKQFMNIKNNIKDNLKNIIESWKYQSNKLESDKWEKVINAFIIISILILPIMNLKLGLDTDTYFILNSGRFIENNGLYTNEPFTMHDGLNFIFQQWLTNIYFWFLYSRVGKLGLILVIYVQASVINILAYKLHNKLFNNRLASFIGILVLSEFVGYYYTTRPQLTTIINVILVLFVMEKYATTNKIKYLLGLIPITILEVNLHSAIWWILIVFMLPYLFDFIDIKSLGIESDKSYRKIPVACTIIIMILASFINPYGAEASFYLFKSLGSEYKNAIQELRPLSCNSAGFYAFILVIVAIVCISLYNRIKYKNQTIKIRYLYLFIGCTLMYIKNIRSVVFFGVGVSLYIVYKLCKNKIDKLCILIVTITLIALSTINILNTNWCNSYIAAEDVNESDELRDLEKIKNYLLNNNNTGCNLYTDFNTGAYFEFYGFKCYMDARMEVMLKSINNKYDYFDEYCEYKDKYKELFSKYDFDYYIIEINSINYDYITYDNDYIEELKTDSYALYRRCN